VMVVLDVGHSTRANSLLTGGWRPSRE
jgi:hypothetical protein